MVKDKDFSKPIPDGVVEKCHFRSLYFFFFLSFYFHSGMAPSSQQPMLDSMNAALMPVESQVANLTPTWEELKHFQKEQIKCPPLSVSMDRLDLEMNPPVDR